MKSGAPFSRYDIIYMIYLVVKCFSVVCLGIYFEKLAVKATLTTMELFLRKEVQFFFRINHKFSRRFGRRLQPIFRQYVNLINHNTIQWYSVWNTSNRMLSEEKSKENWSMLMSSQDITLLLHPVMSKCRYPVSAYSNFFQ